MPFIYGLIAGAVLQTVGFALLSTIPTTADVWPGQYGYYVIAGLGTGASIGTQYLMAPLVVDHEDKRTYFALPDATYGRLVQLTNE